MGVRKESPVVTIANIPSRANEFHSLDFGNASDSEVSTKIRELLAADDEE